VAIGFSANTWTWDGDMHPNDEHYWITWGPSADYGRLPLVWAAPLGTTRGLPPYEQILIVKDLRAEIGADGARRLLYTIKNLSGDIVYDYLIAVAYSDIV